MVEIGNRKVSLFPNPAGDWIQVEDGVKDGNLAILNGIGETVFSTAFNEKARIDISMFSTGIYYLMLKDPSGSQVLTETFIKN